MGENGHRFLLTMHLGRQGFQERKTLLFSYKGSERGSLKTQSNQGPTTLRNYLPTYLLSYSARREYVFNRGKMQEVRIDAPHVNCEALRPFQSVAGGKTAKPVTAENGQEPNIYTGKSYSLKHFSTFSRTYSTSRRHINSCQFRLMWLPYIPN